MGESLVQGAARTHTIFIKFTVLPGCSSWCTRTIAKITSKMGYHHKIMKKFKILRKLSKCDTETCNEQMLLENWC